VYIDIIDFDVCMYVCMCVCMYIYLCGMGHGIEARLYVCMYMYAAWVMEQRLTTARMYVCMYV
jgi:hypothetical protein